MTPQELKNSILQLAIQGKLVEQRPEEGTAEELFVQIQEEKQRLIKEGKIKKEKPLPEITEDEKPFDIPESWMWIRHNELFEIIGGSQPPKSKFSDIKLDGYVRLYQIRDYGEKPVPVYVPKQFVSKFTVDGDILLARYGGSLGKVFWAKSGAYNVAMAKVNFLFEKDYILKAYIYYYYLAPLYQKLVRNNSRSAQAGFNKDDLNNLMFPLPPLAEQKRIVAKIEELLPYIERYEQAWSKLEQFNSRFPEDMNKSLLQYAIQGKLVEQCPEEGTAEELFAHIQEEKQRLIKEGKIKKEKPLPEITEDEKPFDIPESWKWVRLVELGSFSSGKTPDMTNRLFWENGTVNWMTSKDMKERFLSESQMKISKVAVQGMTVYEPGTLLMVVRSGILKRMLPLCILTQLSTINQDLKAYSLFCNDMSTYVYYMLKALEPNILFNYTKRVTTVDSLKFDEFSCQMLVPLPNIAEQKRIVKKLEQLLPLCERLK